MVVVILEALTVVAYLNDMVWHVHRGSLFYQDVSQGCTAQFRQVWYLIHQF